MKKLLVICGPTASGKTALGIKLAKKFDGEIVSADSRQVYRYMDIGTGKDLSINPKFEILNPKWFDKLTIPSEVEGQIPNPKSQIPNYQIGCYLVETVPVWLLDVVEPDYRFSVADYVKCANLVIKNIWKRGKLPILVGGTGLYIKAVIDGIETIGIKPDWELREKLSNYPISKLANCLKKIDPQRWENMNRSDRRNPRRLVRAIEIGFKLKTKNEKLKTTIKNLKFEKLLMIGLKTDYKSLYKQIDNRLETRVEQGVVDEIRKLLKTGYTWENSALGQTIGYKEWQPYIESSKFDFRVKARKVAMETRQVQSSKFKEEVIQRWKYDEHALARRQMTWFKKDKRIVWFDISQRAWQNRINRAVKKWYSE